MNKDEFLKMLDDCLNDGSLEIDFNKGQNFYGTKEPDEIVISINSKQIYSIYL